MKGLYKKYFILSGFAIFIFSMSNSAVFAQEKITDLTILDRLVTKRDFTGAWKINPEESDDVLKKLQNAGRNWANTDKDGTNNSLPTISVSLFPPDALVLAADENDQITINEEFSNIVLTRTIPANGAVQIAEISPGVNYLVTANRKNNVFSVETKSPRGNKMFENYALSPLGDKLIVNVRFENAAAQEILNLVRVYERQTISVFSGGDDFIQ